MNKSQRIAAALALGLAAMTAQADYKAASAALQAQDYAKAVPLLQESAKAGDSDAMVDLAKLYWNGTGGVARDPDAAVSWLRKACLANNPTALDTLGRFYFLGVGVDKDLMKARGLAEKAAGLGNGDAAVLYYQTVLFGPELDYRTDGKPDINKYTAIAKRSLDERGLDRKAYDMLGKGLDQGVPQAKVLAAGEVSDKVGPGNRAHALALINGIQPPLPEALGNIKGTLEAMGSLGDSYTNMVSFLNARRMALMAAAMLGQESGVLGADCSADQLKVSHTEISRALADASYLPTTTKELQNVYLIAGNWQETWTFDACGKSIAVPIEFHADGFGGAYFTSKAKPAAK